MLKPIYTQLVFFRTGLDQTEIAPRCCFCQLKTEALSIKGTAVKQNVSKYKRFINKKYTWCITNSCSHDIFHQLHFEHILSYSHFEAQLIYKCFVFIFFLKKAAKSVQMRQSVDSRLPVPSLLCSSRSEIWPMPYVHIFLKTTCNLQQLMIP